MTIRTKSFLIHTVYYELIFFNGFLFRNFGIDGIRFWILMAIVLVVFVLGYCSGRIDMKEEMEPPK